MTCLCPCHHKDMAGMSGVCNACRCPCINCGAPTAADCPDDCRPAYGGGLTPADVYP